MPTPKGTTMTTVADDDERRWNAGQAVRKAEANADDDLACAIAELEGGDSEVERTEARANIFSFVFARRRALRAARKH